MVNSRYIADQNKVVMINESGTYGSTSGAGVWIGQVTDNSIDDVENVIVSRYLGTTTRSFDSTDGGPRDVTGTLTYHPQDMRAVFWAIGSVSDISGPISIHTATEINTDSIQSPFTSGTLNPPISFTLEDSKQAPGTGKNFIRTINGVVPNNTTLTASQGEKVTVEIEYVGQTNTFSSGATTSLTQETNTPYLWSHTSTTLAGSNLQSIKEAFLSINQNIESPHYLNGSRDISVPFPQNREYTYSITMDLNSDDGNLLYNDLYKTNGSFNATFDLNADNTGSQHVTFVMSGCRIVNTPDIPSSNEGVTEVTFEVQPQTVSATSYDSTAATAKYNPF